MFALDMRAPYNRGMSTGNSSFHPLPARRANLTINVQKKAWIFRLNLCFFLILCLGLSSCDLLSAIFTPQKPSQPAQPPVLPTATPKPLVTETPILTETPLPANLMPLRLAVESGPRQLPKKMLGASADPMIEDLLNNPEKVYAVGLTAPAVLRFPGGTAANYYNWRTGLFSLADPLADNSPEYKFWAELAPRITSAKLKGTYLEDYQSLASGIGADMILVPNLETSTVEEQVAWFSSLAQSKLLSPYIELGNKFWDALGGDPVVVQKWPDAPAAMAVMKQYASALRPVTGPGVKFAVQAAAARFNNQADDPDPLHQRLLKWDQQLTSEEWFRAVTVHLYLDPDRIAAENGTPGPEELFRLFMGRADAGVDRVLNELSKKLPGKEIWITEWNPQGGNPVDQTRQDPVSQGMMVHLAARQTLSILRHPEVSKSLFFMLYSGKGIYQAYVMVGDGYYDPMPATVVLQWFNEAANNGGTFQRVVEPTSQPVTGLGNFSESYRPVEGGMFRSSKGTTLILQNASSQDYYIYDLSQIGVKSIPSKVEIIIANNMTEYNHIPAAALAPDPARTIVIPAYSVARLIWN